MNIVKHGKEMYVKNVLGFAGEGDFVSRFGLEIRDQVTFTISKKRFEVEVANGSFVNTYSSANVEVSNGNYTGGYSDHYPVYMYLIKEKK